MPPFPAGSSSTPSRPPVPTAAEPEPGEEAEDPKKKKLLVLKKAGIAVGILVGFIGVFAFYRAFFAPLRTPPINVVAKSPAPKPKPVVPTPPPTPKPDPAATTVAAVPAPEAPKLAPNPDHPETPPPAPKTEHLVVTSSTDLAPGIKATTSEETEGPAASAPFLQWVDNAKIGGVFQGKTPRAIINGKIARGGTVVDDDLGIIFSTVDVDERMVIFKDKSGATAKKHY